MRYITEINVLTGEEVERPMTDEENAQADIDEQLAKQAEEPSGQ